MSASKINWVDNTAVVQCIGGVTLLTVRANGDLEIAGDGWKAPSKRAREYLGISRRNPNPGVNAVCRFGDESMARRVAVELAKLLIVQETGSNTRR